MAGAVNDRRSESLPDLPAPEATRADADALGRSVDDGANALKVRIECPFRLVIGVTNVMA